MKVISKFKDFYDYVAHVYGGGDPTITYVRSPIGEPLDQESNSTFRKTVSIEIAGSLDFRHSNPYGNGSYRIKHLIVAGVPYTLHSPLIERTVYGETWGDWKVLDPTTIIEGARNRWYMYSMRETIQDGVQNTKLIELSQKLGHPVFIIDHVSRSMKGDSIVAIEGVCPNLGELGFAAIKSAEQTYQDISYFVGNTMLVPTPDNMPVVKMTDKEKILSHGLDPKVSFRHRK